MNALLHWLTTPEWSQVVKTLLHSLWQGALIAAALVLIMRRLANPSARYRCSLAALAAIPAAGIITWAILNASINQPPPAPMPIATAASTSPDLISLDQDAVTQLMVFAGHTPAPPQTHWTAWLALVWLVGAVAMLGRAGVKVTGAERLRRSCQPLDHPQIIQLVAEARRAVGLAREIRVAFTDKLTSPAVVGVLVPTLILPFSLVTTLTPEQIRFILLHELAHIRRGDYFANLFQLFVEALLFFNPAVWWISHQVRREREACCDALAIELSGAPADYARTLVHVAESALHSTFDAAPAFGGEREPSSLSDRIQRLLVPDYRPTLRLTWRAMIAAFVLGAALLVLSAEGTRVAVAQITKSPEKPAETNTIRSRELESLPGITNQFPTDFDLGNRSDQSSLLFTRQFGLDTNSFHELLGSSLAFGDTNSIRTLAGSLRTFFAEAGVDLDPRAGKSIFYGVGRHTLLVRATEEELDRVESLLQSIRQKSPQATSRTWLETNSPNLEFSGLNKDSRVEHNLTDGKTIITNGGLVRFGDTTVRSDSIQFDHKTGSLVATGNAKLEGSSLTNNTSQLELNIRSSQPATGTSAGPTKLIYRSEARRALLNKLKQIQFDRVSFNATPLDSVIGHLQWESWRRDPDGLGITFVFDYDLKYKVFKPTDDPFDLLNTRVTINPPLTNVPVLDVLQAIVKGASKPIHFAIEENAVVISAGKGITPLFLREYKVSPVFFDQLREKGFGIESTATNRSATLESVRRFLTQAGVALEATEGKSIFYNDRLGVFLVRATSEELDRVEALIHELNNPDPRINIKVRFVEVSPSELETFVPDLIAAMKPAGGTNWTGNLTEPQMNQVLQRIQINKNISLLSEGEVTTGSGRQAQLQTVELRNIVTGINPQALTPPGITSTNQAATGESSLITTTLPFGSTIDLIPTITTDGYSIGLTITPQVAEFLGYERSTNTVVYENGKKGKLPYPLPQLRTRQITINATVRDGMTLVLGAAPVATTTLLKDKVPVLGDIPLLGKLFRHESSQVHTKVLIVFVTPTIVDPAGNRAKASATNKAGVDESFQTSSNLFPIFDKPILY